MFFLGWANLATLPTFSIITNHVKRVLFTLTSLSPYRAVLILVHTIPFASLAFLVVWFLEGPYVNPLGCRPLLSLNNRATSMQAACICSCIGIKTEEQQGITLFGFHCMVTKRKFQIAWWWWGANLDSIQLNDRKHYRKRFEHRNGSAELVITFTPI